MGSNIGVMKSLLKFLLLKKSVPVLSRQARVALPDQRELCYKIRISPRAKNLRLKVTAWDGLSVVAPRGMSHKKIERFVAEKRHWIKAHLDEFEQFLTPGTEHSMRYPNTIELPALAETWKVEYQKTEAKKVSTRVPKTGELLISGLTSDWEQCEAALRRWLMHRANQVLIPWLESLSEETSLRYSRVSIRNQRTRWGSCSSKGAISLNCKLLFFEPEMVRYVLIHELCHTQEQNHSSSFWNLMSHYEPEAATLRTKMRKAWQWIPTWAY